MPVGKQHPIGAVGVIVAANVHRLRRSHGWNQAKLASLVEVAGRRMSLGSISEVERCVRRVDVDDLLALAVALQVSPALLMTGEPEASGVALTP